MDGTADGGAVALLEKFHQCLDRAVARWTMVATHRGALAGTAPTERRIAEDGIVIYRTDERGIAEVWRRVDRLGLLEQLGAIPTMNIGPRSAPRCSTTLLAARTAQPVTRHADVVPA